MRPEQLLKYFDEVQPRRIKIIFNLLKNRKTVSNLFWGLEYGTLIFLNFAPTLSDDEFYSAIKLAIQKDWLKEVAENQVILTDQGKLVQQNQPKGKPSSIQARLDSEKFRAALSLAIQIVSEFSFENSKYSPVSFDQSIQFRTKYWFAKARLEATFVDDFKKELGIVLGELDQLEADFLMNINIAHNESGMTIKQLATASDRTESEVDEIIRIAISKIAAYIEKNGAMVPLLNALLMPYVKNSALPSNAIKTYQSFQNGLEISVIAQNLHLKVNTIREHLLMAAILVPNFPFNKINNLPSFIHKYQLSNIKPVDWDFSVMVAKNPNLTFYQFRLAQIERSKQVD